MNFQLITNQKTKKGQHLFAPIVVNDRRRFFIVDSGSDLSYIFIKPLNGVLHKKFTQVAWLTQGKTGAQLMLFDRSPFWYSDKPGPVKEMEKDYAVQISGILGIDYLVAHKIVLDFSQF